jgi:hypothetical protein
MNLDPIPLSSLPDKEESQRQNNPWTPDDRKEPVSARVDGGRGAMGANNSKGHSTVSIYISRTLHSELQLPKVKLRCGC